MPITSGACCAQVNDHSLATSADSYRIARRFRLHRVGDIAGRSLLPGFWGPSEGSIASTNHCACRRATMDGHTPMVGRCRHHARKCGVRCRSGCMRKAASPYGRVWMAPIYHSLFLRSIMRWRHRYDQTAWRGGEVDWARYSRECSGKDGIISGLLIPGSSNCCQNVSIEQKRPEYT